VIYSRYFSSITKENGQPNLNSEQFRRMMNIVYTEGVINGLSMIKEKDKAAYFKYDMLIFNHRIVLTNLTGNLKPGDLLKEMYRLSQN
jgi:hypothetical protein